jgi:hypothetical protein
MTTALSMNRAKIWWPSNPQNTDHSILSPPLSIEPEVRARCPELLPNGIAIVEEAVFPC